MRSKKNKKNKSHVPVRLNVLFFGIFILFSILVIRLSILQLVEGEDYLALVKRTEEVSVDSSVPRGKVYDRNGNVIIDNDAQNAITFTNTGFSQAEMLKTAANLARIIEKDASKVTVRDKKDYWIILNSDRAKAKVSEEETTLLKEEYKDTELDQAVYKLTLDRITDEELAELTEADLEVLAIYREMSANYMFSEIFIKNTDVSDEEFARVSENLQSLSGVNTTTDWVRNYVFDNTLLSVLGKVTDSNEGLPADKLDYFLARGYSRNERVGKSYLEMKYEDVLAGQKAKEKVITDSSGNIVEIITVSEGQRGDELVLSIDMELQQAVDQIIETQLLNAKKLPKTELLDRAYVVLMDPHTGEILTMAGKRLYKQDDGSYIISDDALGNFTTSYQVGSVVKGATIMAGYQTGALQPGTTYLDTPMKIAQTIKSSWKNLGVLDDITALQKSSNIYMFHVAIKMANGVYVYGNPLPIDTSAFQTLRNIYASFGLGIRTGIDLPNETTGFKGTSVLPGYLLDLSIGQYDTYSNMQLAQYVSTIANGGYRLQPRLVKEIRDASTATDTEIGVLVQEMHPKVLNVVEGEEEWWERIHEGFRRVTQMQGGTAYSFMGTLPYLPAGKTGTAQGFYDGPYRSNYGAEPPEVINLSFVGYAPYDNPEVAISVIVPWAYTSGSGHYTNLTLAKEVLNTYFSLKEQRAQSTNSNETADTIQTIDAENE